MEDGISLRCPNLNSNLYLNVLAEVVAQGSFVVSNSLSLLFDNEKFVQMLEKGSTGRLIFTRQKAQLVCYFSLVFSRSHICVSLSASVSVHFYCTHVVFV